jgi:hypothetical protein
MTTTLRADPPAQPRWSPEPLGTYLESFRALLDAPSGWVTSPWRPPRCLDANLELKEKVLAKTTPFNVRRDATGPTTASSRSSRASDYAGIRCREPARLLVSGHPPGIIRDPALCRLCRARHKRHTFASLLIAQGAHPKYIQAQLGHASIQTTLDRYGHLMPDAHATEARKLDRLVFGENGHHDAGRVAADAVQRVQNGCRNDEGASENSR